MKGEREACSREELDGHSELWGWRFSEGGSYGLITLYVEDDGKYHPVDMQCAVARMLAQSNAKGQPWRDEHE